MLDGTFFGEVLKDSRIWTLKHKADIKKLNGVDFTENRSPGQVAGDLKWFNPPSL